jgi:P27 family predicted phage terminase small subunit
MSNPPVPFIVRKLRGNPGRRPMRAEPQPALLPKCPEPLPFITGYAADEWWRVAPELHALGLLTSVDVATLSAYCYSYGIWRDAAEALAKIAARDEATHGLLIKGTDGNARRNPLVKIASDAAEDMLRFASEFALTPVARSRLAAGIYSQPAPPSKFDGLLASPIQRPKNEG